ncbi:5-oxoprolinase subunit PxpB [Polaribacter batillariae]|uniref:5-oxoprolinase subunit PxpB n=1 Tax=Polaribacter batillariae TaxID=2808900 RepID=A0ABX7SZL9_9FLAO|nr:5-oxoprolinase subunit PxpB [Polaribacter batillariae]QTD38948.1 5-oxoprolinase subunit PxpB [Polaribacter batillariae]
MHKKTTYKPFGNAAILIEWQAIISKEILNDIILFKEKIKKEKATLITDFIIGYNSLTLKYKNEIGNYCNEVESLKLIYKQDFKLNKVEKILWEIPVCYDLEFGIDLEEISEKSNLSVEEIIKIHSKKTYTVFFIGFLPGFLYLGGLDKQLHFDRKPNPRLKVPKGALAIGGKQTGVYPQESAGGWHIVGKTPIHFFDIKNENLCFAKSGDQIKFKAISLEEFYQTEKEVLKNNYIISKTLLNG